MVKAPSHRQGRRDDASCRWFGTHDSRTDVPCRRHDRDRSSAALQRGRLPRRARVLPRRPTAWAATTTARSRAASRSRPSLHHPAGVRSRTTSMTSSSSSNSPTERSCTTALIHHASGMGTTIVGRPRSSSRPVHAARRVPRRRLALLPTLRRSARARHPRPLPRARAHRRRSPPHRTAARHPLRNVLTRALGRRARPRRRHRRARPASRSVAAVLGRRLGRASTTG